MVDVADIDVPEIDARALNLRVATETKVHVALDQQLRVDGAVRRMANGATFAQGLVFEDKWTGLFPVTLSAGLIHARHGQPARRLENVAAVGIVTLGAVHVLLEDRVVLGQTKLSLDRTVALETSRRILSGVDNKLPLAAATGDVQAAGAVAGLAAGLAGGAGVIQADARMGAAREDPRDICVTLGAGFVPDEGGAGDVRRRGQTDGNR
jgi:hypothetical protein